MENNFDTICAIITPLSLGAVGIIRLSGDKSFDIANEIFDKKIKPKMINYGHIIDNDTILDEVIVLPFVSPISSIMPLPIISWQEKLLSSSNRPSSCEI